MCKSLTNYFPRNNDFLVTYFGKTQILIRCDTLWETDTRSMISALPEGFVFADKARLIVAIGEFRLNSTLFTSLIFRL